MHICNNSQRLIMNEVKKMEKQKATNENEIFSVIIVFTVLSFVLRIHMLMHDT